MPQAGFTPIQTYNSPTAGHIPVYTDLYAGELAINTTDEKLYFKNTGGTVKLLASTAVFTTTGSGSYVLATSPTITGHPTIEGVTSTGATGTGKFVFDSAPTITGHPTIEGVTSTGATGTGKFVFDSSPTLSGVTLSDGTANGVAYLNSSKVLTSGSGLVYDSSGNLGLGVVPSGWTSGGNFDIGATKSLSASDSNINIGANFFYGSGGFTYKTTGAASYYNQSSGLHRWLTAPSGTAGNAISFTQVMTLDASGNLLVGKTSATSNGGDVQVSKGVAFPATQVACSDPNTLDDYEEGTWTPTDASGAGLTFTITGAQYVKVGQIVTAIAVFSYPITANSAEGTIGGLPFTTSLANTTGSVLSSNAGAQKIINNSSTTLLLFPVNSTSPSTNATLSNAGIYLSITYRCDT